MNSIIGPCNISQNGLRLYTRVVWKNYFQPTRKVVLISPRFTAIINVAKWWIHSWQKNIRESKLNMQKRNNLFRDTKKMIALFKNVFKQHNPDSHVWIYYVLWWDILLWNQQRSFISKQEWWFKVFRSAHDNAQGKLGLQMSLQIFDWRICARAWWTTKQEHKLSLITGFRLSTSNVKRSGWLWNITFTDQQSFKTLKLDQITDHTK